MLRHWSGILALTLGFGAGLLVRHAASDSREAADANSLHPTNPASPGATANSSQPNASDPAKRSIGHLPDVLAWLPEAGVQDILNLLDEWDHSDSPPHQTARLWCILRLAEQDPALGFKLAEAHAERFPDYYGTVNPVWLLANFLGASDPHRFADRAWLESLGIDPKHCGHLVGFAKQEIVRTDPLPAFQTAHENGLPLIRIARSLAKKDPIALASELDQLGPAYPGFSTMAHALMASWLKQDPAAAQEWLSRVDDPDLRANLQYTVALTSARSEENRVEGAALVNALPPGRQRASSLNSFLRTWAAEDFTAASQWAATKLSSFERALVLSQISEQFMESDPLRALEVLHPYRQDLKAMPRDWPIAITGVELPDGSSHSPRPYSYGTSPERVLDKARRKYATLEPQQFLEFEMTRTGNATDERMPSAAQYAVQHLTAKDPAMAIDWIATQPEHHWQPELLREAGKTWGKEDLPSARRWLDTNSDSPGRAGIAIGVAAEIVRQQMYREAWDLAGPMGTHPDAHGTLMSIGFGWIRRNPEEARAAIEQTELTDSLRRNLNAALERAKTP